MFASDYRIVDNKTYEQLDAELTEAYTDLVQYRRALIFAVKQMTPEQRTQSLKSCKSEFFGAMLGAVMVSKIPQKQ